MATTFSGMAAFRGTPLNVPGMDRPERVDGADITADFFDVMGVAAKIGVATSSPRARTVVLSDAFWKRRWTRAMPR